MHPFLRNKIMLHLSGFYLLVVQISPSGLPTSNYHDQQTAWELFITPAAFHPFFRAYFVMVKHSLSFLSNDVTRETKNSQESSYFSASSKMLAPMCRLWAPRGIITVGQGDRSSPSTSVFEVFPKPSEKNKIKFWFKKDGIHSGCINSLCGHFSVFTDFVSMKTEVRFVSCERVLKQVIGHIPQVIGPAWCKAPL